MKAPPAGAPLYTLYIANRTRQRHDFQYRLPSEMQRARSEMIEPHGERRIYQEAPLPVLRAIIDHHVRRYGLVPIDRAGAGFVGLCYRFDPPVDLDEEDRRSAERAAEEDRRLAERAAAEAAEQRARSDAIDAELVALEAMGDEPQMPEQPPAPLPPKGRRGYAEEDQPLVEEMHRLIAAKKARNPWDATNAVVDRAIGSGDIDARRKRLLKRYAQLFRTV